MFDLETIKATNQLGFKPQANQAIVSKPGPLFRIFTEDKNRESIFQILDSHLDGYTVTPSIGAWKAQRENSLIIDVLDASEDVIQTIAAEIKTANEQESVLILVLAARSRFV